jgi:PhnB protein
VIYPYLCVRQADEAVAFYVAALGARESFRLVEPGGRVGHVELQIGEATLMLAEEFPELGVLAPAPGERCPLMLHLHVDDADATIARALRAGASLVSPARDHLHGERSGRIRDPFGYEWLLGHTLEALSPEEMQRRYSS